MFRLFLAGNVIYYISGIALAFALKDNRAFCKYLCPVTVFLKPMSYFSVLRVHCDESGVSPEQSGSGETRRERKEPI
mgnify:CR=1 FL=1